MACNNTKLKEPLQSGSVTPTPQTTMTDAPRRRKSWISKSASFAHSVSMETIGSVPTPGKLDPNLVHVAIFLVVYLTVGTLCFYHLGPQMKGKKTSAIVDTFYFCIVTMATVGYGDLVPDSVLTKLLACAFAFTGMALVAVVMNKAADYLIKKQEDLVVNALNMQLDVGPTEIRKEVRTKGVRYRCLLVFILLLVLIFVGTTFLATVEKLDLIDAFYCACVTITTLGYGDQSFKTKGGRIFAVFWILISTITLAQFFVYIAELNTESRHWELVKRVLSRKMTEADVEAADLDQDNSLQTAEFILYKLQEMGKISKDDISLVKETFEHCDVDQSET
ncbi:two-pore potassium channel 1-like [Corylus avellana]|uniref:two-pore potassium channel 1-like n=1 Tax=Corylus avellana TaxID=13451 RepID=UPI001E1FAA74|nr:two-pore potassium channel 1-like [Corylus avellana]